MRLHEGGENVSFVAKRKWNTSALLVYNSELGQLIEHTEKDDFHLDALTPKRNVHHTKYAQAGLDEAAENRNIFVGCHTGKVRGGRCHRYAWGCPHTTEACIYRGERGIATPLFRNSIRGRGASLIIHVICSTPETVTPRQR